MRFGFKGATGPPEKPVIQLSVIIPTYNRPKRLNHALESLTHQTLSLEAFEVIVVNNSHDDAAKTVAEIYSRKIPNFRYIRDTVPGLHVGRHKGMEVARSEILVYADDDIEAFPTWLQAIAEAFQNGETVLVGGKNLPRFEVVPPVWISNMWQKDVQGNQVVGYLSILNLGDEKKRVDPSYIFGCNFAIRKSVLLEVGGFHPDSIPDSLAIYRGDGETHVAKSIKARERPALYDPMASVYHHVPKERMTETYFRNRSYRQGISDSYSAIREKGLHFDLLLYRHCLLAHLKSVFLPYPQRQICGAYWNGYFQHQWAVRKNKALREWVEKEHYF
jgi:glucosyl-dolichyl phosphate glucuronosyltransferase